MVEVNGKIYKTFEFDKIDQKKYVGFIYITVNKVNGDKYAGQHTKYNEVYFGSGTYISRALKKYGIINFERHIIELCETQDELDERETYWINEGFGLNIAKSEGWYNIKDGAQSGGNPFAGMSEEDFDKHRKKMSEANSLPIIVLREGKVLGEYASILEYSKELGSIALGSTVYNAVRRLSNGWIPKKNSKWYGLEVIRKKEYEISSLEEIRSERIKAKEERRKLASINYSKGRADIFGGNNPRARPLILFKDGVFIGEFSATKEAGLYLEGIIGGSLEDGVRALAGGWIPSKRSQLHGYTASYKENKSQQESF